MMGRFQETFCWLRMRNNQHILTDENDPGEDENKEKRGMKE